MDTVTKDETAERAVRVARASRLLTWMIPPFWRRGGDSVVRAPLLWTALALFASAGCSDEPGPPPAPPATWDGKIEVYGALHEIFHDDDVSAEVHLADLLPNDELFAVGALAELDGEVTIVRGRTFVATPDDAGGAEHRELDDGRVGEHAATLLVATKVPGWRALPTLQRIPFDQLGGKIAELAFELGYSEDERIPFLIEGQVEELKWHVIDGRLMEGGGDSHEEHLEASVRDSRDVADATLIGFYSPSDQGVFTHRGSTVHVHVVVFDPLATGHVDHVVIPEGTNVMFPLPGADE